MRPAFSWLMLKQERPRVLSRFMLLGATLVRADRVDGEWCVKWTARHSSFDRAILVAVAETKNREWLGFILDGGVWITETDVDAEALAAECVGRMGLGYGPLLHALLLEATWRCL